MCAQLPGEPFVFHILTVDSSVLFLCSSGCPVLTPIRRPQEAPPQSRLLLKGHFRKMLRAAQQVSGLDGFRKLYTRWLCKHPSPKACAGRAPCTLHRSAWSSVSLPSLSKMWRRGTICDGQLATRACARSHWRRLNRCWIQLAGR